MADITSEGLFLLMDRPEMLIKEALSGRAIHAGLTLEGLGLEKIRNIVP